ncbi:Ivy family c-type lysozyme inhibitor [Ancylobacter lacus]|uniref:Ivy family c-type lysozyme inhibitor n=1 Tax=Ancylobacter lacus TaxID=2579970 RepID=UPI001BCC9B69|nr:Ivy family c-type lysozyme inhibitor [Ancylobacter lacus]MBS7540137.1 hypothetical protein [Ancylobacter lacus]
MAFPRLNPALAVPPVPTLALAALALLLPAGPAAAQLRDQADTMKLMTAAGISAAGGKILNACGHPTNPRVMFIDLDGDGSGEAVTQDIDPACYPDPGTQSLVLHRNAAGDWDVVAKVPGVIRPLGTRSRGWADFTLQAKGCQPVWRFDGHGYVATPCADAAAQASTAKPAVPPVAPPPSAASAPAAPAPAAPAPAASAPAGPPNPDLALFPATHGDFAPKGDCTLKPKVTIAADAIRLDTAAGAGTFARANAITNYMGPDDDSISYALHGGGDGLIVSVKGDGLWSMGGDGLSAAEKALDAAASVPEGKAALRRCGAAATATAATATAAAPPPAAPAAPVSGQASTVDAFADKDAMSDAGFRAAYLKVLGPLARREDWLVDMQGPGQQKAVSLAGTRYLLVAVCKPHDCGDNAMMVLYRPETRELFGIVSVTGAKKPLGNPPPALRGEVMKLWKETWPAG